LDYQFDKHFTLDEANAMIPHVRRLFDEIRHLMQPLADGEHPLPSNGNGNGNGHASKQPANAYDEWSEEKRHEAAYRLLNALQQQGIVIQDVERGLIDFPSIQNGREVFLCYELTDGHFIEYFHDLDAGYAGRQKITGEQQ